VPESSNAKYLVSDDKHFGALLGLKLVENVQDVAVLELVLRENHCNRTGAVHGGVITSMLDVVGLWAGADPSGAVPNASTASLTCRFLRGARLGETHIIRARGEVSKRGRNLYFSNIQAHAFPSGDLLATGQGVFAVFAKRGTSSEA
jgi:uncharacterized protein (TIGR00369 family)